MFDTFLFVESFNLNVSLGNFISLISSFPQAWNSSFFLLLLGVSRSDDFIAKYDKYNTVCRRMGYQDKQCEERGIIIFLITYGLIKKYLYLNSNCIINLKTLQASVLKISE